MRTESWHRVRKEEHEGESKCRVSKVNIAKFGHQTNQKRKEMKQRTSFISWPKSKIPEAAAAEILEDYIML
jgi:hypothetical protein